MVARGPASVRGVSAVAGTEPAARRHADRAGDAATALGAAEVALVADARWRAVRVLPRVRGWSFLPARAGRRRLATCWRVACRRRGWSLALIVGGARWPAWPCWSTARLLPRRQLLRAAHERDVGRHVGRPAERRGRRSPPPIAPVPATTGFVVAVIIARLARRPSWPTASPSGPRRRSRRSCRPASSSCSAPRSAATASACSSPPLWLGRRPRACRPPRVDRPGGRRAGSAGIRRRRRRPPLRGSARIGAGAVVLALIVGPALPGAGCRGAARHPQRRLGDAPDAQPARRHPRPHRQPERHRGCSRCEPTARRTGASPPSTSSTAASGRRRAAYGDADGRPRGRPAERPQHAARTRTITITGLDVDLAPGGVRPGRIVDPGATSATTPRRPASSPRRSEVRRAPAYTVVARCPTLDAATPAGSHRAGARAASPSTTSQLPANFPANLSRAGRATSPPTPRRRTRRRSLLQNWFRRRSPTTSSVPPGHGDDAIERLPRRSAGATASSSPAPSPPSPASLGIPARVAVGFTPGELRRRRRLPRARASTPTPGPRSTSPASAGCRSSPPPAGARPAPRATPACRSSRSGAGAASPRPPPRWPAPRRAPTVSIAPLRPTATSASPTSRSPTSAWAVGLVSSGGGRPWIVSAGIVLLVLLVLAVIWILLVPRLIPAGWRRRRRAAHSEADQVLVSWHEHRGGAWPLRRRAPPSETPSEFAGRAPPADPDRRRRPRAAGRPRDPGRLLRRRRRPEVVTDADGIRDQAAGTLHHRADLRTRLTWRADPRPLLQPLPGDHERRRHLELVDR